MAHQPAFIGAIMVSVDLDPNQLGNYHIAAGSVAVDAGAASKSVPPYQQLPATLAAPTFDIDNQARPGGCSFDIGADELPGASCTAVNLSIAKTDGLTSIGSGAPVTYTITVGKAATGVITNAIVTDAIPANITGATWTCSASGTGSSCASLSGTGSINTTVTLGRAAGLDGDHRGHRHGDGNRFGFQHRHGDSARGYVRHQPGEQLGHRHRHHHHPAGHAGH